MSNEKVIDRIRKLLALAGSANENEAASAADKAQTLLTEYNLTLADVNAAAEGYEVDGELVSDSRPWRRKVAANVARLYFCDYAFGFVRVHTDKRKCGYVRLDRHHFIGAPHNIIVAKAIFRYLCDTIDRLARVGAESMLASKRTSYMTSFRHSCAERLCNRLTARFAEITDPAPELTYDNSRVPALYNSELEKVSEFMQAQMSTSVVEFEPRLSSIVGAIDGYAAAGSIGLDVQVEASADRQHLEGPRNE